MGITWKTSDPLFPPRITHYWKSFPIFAVTWELFIPGKDTKTKSMKKVYESPDTEEIKIQVENFILGYGELPPSEGDEE